MSCSTSQDRRAAPPGTLLRGVGRMLLLLCASCSPLADVTYQGEVLAAVEGVLVDSLGAAAPVASSETSAALLWRLPGAAPGDSRLCSHEDAVFSQRGARVSIPVYELPPDVRVSLAARYPEPVPAGEPRVAIAQLLVLSRDGMLERLRGCGASVRSQLLAAGDGHALVAVDAPVRPGTAAHRALGVELEPGFHLMTVTPRPPEQITAAYTCEAAAGSFAEWLACPSPSDILEPVPLRTLVPVRRVEPERPARWLQWFTSG
jgi:hypothetical protein